MNNEQLDQEVKKLQNEIYGLKRKLINLKLKQGLASKKKPYEVEVLDDLEDYYYIDEAGAVDLVGIYRKYEQKEIYIRGLAFETVEEAEQNDKERILLFKLHKWAEEHNGGWKPDWKDDDEEKYTVRYDYEDNRFVIFYSHSYKEFSKLPCFISRDFAEQFIEEFGDEIKEVFC